MFCIIKRKILYCSLCESIYLKKSQISITFLMNFCAVMISSRISRIVRLCVLKKCNQSRRVKHKITMSRSESINVVGLLTTCYRAVHKHKANCLVKLVVNKGDSKILHVSYICDFICIVFRLEIYLYNDIFTYKKHFIRIL